MIELTDEERARLDGWTPRQTSAQAFARRRFAPHQLRRAHMVELAREGVPLNIIQRQLGHVNLGTTSIYLQGSTQRRSSRL